MKFQLYARYGVPYYWIVDPDAWTIDAYRLAQEVYELTARMEGAQMVALAPFPELILDPAGIWA